MTAPCPTFGFRVVMHVRPGLHDGAVAALRADWTAYLECQGLNAVSEDGASGVVCLVLGEGTQATDGDRTAVGQWLAARGDLAHWTMSDLADLKDRVARRSLEGH